MAHILAIDQGTSSTKALIFDEKGQVLARGSAGLESIYLPDAWVEQDTLEIYQNVLQALALCLREYQAAGYTLEQIQTCGISNQRETFILWDEAGNPLYNAVVWQCKRSTQICERLLQDGLQELIQAKTGLLIDPYFSGTKLLWLYENRKDIRKAINEGRVYFGTVDTWLLYKLTGGQQFATDYSNASRTLFFNLHSQQWDEELLELFQLSGLKLPELKPSAAWYGESDFGGLLPQPISINAMIGDSHAAAFGEACFAPGEAKATLGTGCSILMNTGSQARASQSGMLSTICWSMPGRTDYALEGAIVSCGASLEWLKNEMGLFSDSRETAQMASSISSNGGVYLIPAFSGLGAPYWQMNRKASIHGLSFDSTKSHLVRAALESIAFQIKSVIQVMETESQTKLKALMVHGGISTNAFVMTTLASLLGVPVVYRGMADVSAFGAALLAGLGVGVFDSLEQLEDLFTAGKVVAPDAGQIEAMKLAYAQWEALVLAA